MFASIITFAKNAVTKYKAQRVRAVVDQYCALIDTQVTANMPAVIEFYRGSATAIVDKTFEDPTPAINLLSALGQVTKHYGPALRAEFDVLSTKLEANGASPVFVQRIEALVAAVEALTNDAS